MADINWKLIKITVPINQTSLNSNDSKVKKKIIIILLSISFVSCNGLCG
jgi:hypothetical protein